MAMVWSQDEAKAGEEAAMPLLVASIVHTPRATLNKPTIL
jgi:hypothetical protein